MRRSVSRRWLVALVLAALVGLGGGVTTALVVDDVPTDVDPSSVNDPLRLGIPLVSLGCNGQAVLVLGSGDTAAALTAAVSNAPTNVRYLRTDESCGTRWAAGDDTPAYVAYQGPYDAESQPCETRMEGSHVNDDVTNLNDGTPDFVNCVCVLPDSAAPVLIKAVGDAEVDEDTRTWVTLLQQMLSDLREGKGPEPSGVYDDSTARRIRQFQGSNKLLVTGEVDDATWNMVKDVACGLYDY